MVNVRSMVRLNFQSSEPTLREIQASRSLLPGFAERPMFELKSHLGGRESVEVGSFPPDEAARMKVRAELSGLNVSTEDSFSISYLTLYRSLFESNRASLFDPLWNLAIRERWDGRRAIASFLLVGIDPPAARGCGELLAELASAAWDLSNKVVPFYLVTQFGRTSVLSELERAHSETPDSSHRVKIEGVEYWTRMPAANLVEPFHYFAWEEAIEGTAHDA